MTLPEAFEKDLRPLLSPEEYNRFTTALTTGELPTSIRLNRAKLSEAEQAQKLERTSPVPWCPDGAYLSERPIFTADPLLHAGGYYVQEASSMFLSHVILRHIQHPVCYLDLCAAPGGKTTAALSALPAGSQVICNEIDHKRARILAENIQKWGFPNVSVTSNAPTDFASLRHTFDVISTDVPCSGEGMFRKDAGAIADWSPEKVRDCVKTQRAILDTIWPTLKPGGLLIYSTCTYNVHEDEEMLQYICDELGATPLPVATDAAWHIHPALIGDAPCYRFMPHYTKGEGLFMAIVQKNDDELCCPAKVGKAKKAGKGGAKIPLPLVDLKSATLQAASWIEGGERDFHFVMGRDNALWAIPIAHYELYRLLDFYNLYLLQSGVEMATIKGRDLIPAQGLALSTALCRDSFARCEVNLETALTYLRRDTLLLPAGTPMGYVVICYQNHPLGFVKNMGNRCNNLYPQEWRIRFC